MSGLRWSSMAACSAVLMTSCSGLATVAGKLEGVRTVQSEVVKAVGSQNVRVNVQNDRYMTVGLVNSPLKALPTDARRAKAFELARLAYNTYPERASLQQVAVVYVVHRSYLLFFKVTDATDSFRFDAAELRGAAD
jgi:hypothetical protein